MRCLNRIKIYVLLVNVHENNEIDCVMVFHLWPLSVVRPGMHTKDLYEIILIVFKVMNIEKIALNFRKYRHDFL